MIHKKLPILRKFSRNTIILLGGWLFISSGCTDNENEINPDEDYISISPKIMYNPGRINESFFEIGERIGVFVVPYEQGNTQPGDISQSTYAVNIAHEYNGSAWRPVSGTPIYWPSGGRNVDIYSYYPYISGFSESNPLAANFKVNNNQQTRENFNSSDFLWGNAQNISPQRQPVDLIFQHRLSKIRININSVIDISDADMQASLISLLNVNMSGLIDLSTGNVVQPENPDYGNITTFHHITPITGFRRSAEAIIIPQTLRTNIPFIRIEIPENGTRYSYTPTEEIIFQPGTERSFNITITDWGLTVTVGEINEWLPSGETEGEIGKPLPRVLDLNEINWDQSSVHLIYDNEILIGEVCKEYIFRNNAPRIDYPAILIYLIGQDGILDRSNVFIARVLERNRETPNTGNVHGGSVMWGSNNTLTSYVAGSQPLMNKVEVRAGDIVFTSDNAINTLTINPYRLRDIDGNTYPIIKISSQYWMAENLKVEHFRDGSSFLPFYYNDDLSNKNLYGGLYLWSTAVDSRGLCPDGWHPPSNDEFILLYQYLTPNAGGKLKAKILWSNVDNGDNVSGFTGLPGGRRTNTGTYNEILNYGQWWSTSESGTNNAYRIYLSSGSWAITNEGLNRAYTQSIRCLRDF